MLEIFTAVMFCLGFVIAFATLPLMLCDAVSRAFLVDGNVFSRVLELMIGNLFPKLLAVEIVLVAGIIIFRLAE